ncbi:hypothetical protein ACP70R_028995 [Stipagrostis hirtigluma subsp. patula]
MAAARERKEIERWRRQQMKGLCAKLASLIPKQHYPSSSKERMNHVHVLDAAVAYIKELKERVDQQQQQRSSMTQREGEGASTSAAAAMRGGLGSTEEAAREEMDAAAPPAAVVLHQPLDGAALSLDVAVVSGVERAAPYLMLHEVITVLEEEGAEVLSASLAVTGGKIFCNVHSRPLSPRIGIDDSRVSERLRALV